MSRAKRVALLACLRPTPRKTIASIVITGLWFIFLSFIYSQLTASCGWDPEPQAMDFRAFTPLTHCHTSVAGFLWQWLVILGPGLILYGFVSSMQYVAARSELW